MTRVGVWLLCVAVLRSPLPAGMVVVHESGVDAYAEALEGMRAGMGAAMPAPVDLRATGGAVALARALSAPDIKLVVAIGSRALSEVQARKPAAPVLAAMVMPTPESQSAAARIELDLSLGARLAAMKCLLPRSTRAALIRNTHRAAYTADVLGARARKEGYTAIVVDCDGAAQLLKAIAALRGKADFLLCFPDPELYNPVTIQPLVMASLEARVPLVGYSPALVRAGAVAAIYPDYRELGRQTAEMAQRMLRGDEHPADESPAKARATVNQRIARLFGLEFASAPFPVEVLK